MSANHARDVLDDIDNLRRRIRDLEGSRTLGAQAAVCTSTTHPAPTAGRWILETDTGLYALGNGSAFVYPPQLIKKQVLTGPSASVTFSAIPQVFTNLQLRVSARSDGTGTNGYDSANLRFNGVSTSSYNWNSIFSTQGGAPTNAGGTPTSSAQFAEIWNSHFATAGRGIATVDIPNYSDANNIKIFTSTSSATDGGTAGILQTYDGSLGGTTAAVTSVTALMGTGNFIADSTFCLYGS